MSLTAALLILVQSAAPQASDAPHRAPARASRPVSVQVQAAARIIRPARVTFESADASAIRVTGSQANQVQRRRDANGTLWAEFN